MMTDAISETSMAQTQIQVGLTVDGRVRLRVINIVRLCDVSLDFDAESAIAAGEMLTKIGREALATHET